ncbi:MAG: hypothetical protein JW733_05440 [Coriobacteriia bacterium]|nr:hypothetical protein [Coriobacteriia bacterium]MBN2839961.1 hypothetical protein [Coriobacteriia bacterium]
MIARRTALLVALVSLAMLLAACSGGGGPLPHPAVTAVSELLELRRSDARDAAAYEPYLSDPALAEALAAPSDEPTGTPRVPTYRAPYLSAESTSTADVAVVWEPDGAFPDWTPVTVFSTELTDGRWVVTDAIETTAAPGPLLPEAD